MGAAFQIRTEGKTPKYLQIVNSIHDAIRRGMLRQGDQVFSINELSDEYLLGRDTVQKAYNILRKDGLLVSVPGKGFFINRTDIGRPCRVLMLFNEISHAERQFYNAFIESMGEKAVVDLKIQHFNARLLEEFVLHHLEDYDYFVVMPHFEGSGDEGKALLRQIPPHKLVIVDKDISFVSAPYAAVIQDYKNDISDALEEGLPLLKKYQQLTLIQPAKVHYPPEISYGFRNFCLAHGFRFRILRRFEDAGRITAGEAFVVLEETDLVQLIKAAKISGLAVGKDLGIVSYNETPLKEILSGGITVISTDHTMMARTAVRLIKTNGKEKVRNPFRLIVRNSL